MTTVATARLLTTSALAPSVAQSAPSSSSVVLSMANEVSGSASSGSASSGSASPGSAVGPSTRSWDVVRDPLESAATDIRSAWAVVQDLSRSGRFQEALIQLRELSVRVGTDSSHPESRHPESRHPESRHPELNRRLRCAEIGLEVELGESAPLDELRALIMESESLSTQLVAAYQLAHGLEEDHCWKKAAFYASRALTSAQRLDDRNAIAAAHNLMGNVLAGDSRFSQAETHYRCALKLEPGVMLWRAQVEDNLAYAVAAQGRHQEARHHLARALWTLRKHEGRARISVDFDAAFVLGLCDQPHAALRHAVHGLQLARQLDDRHQIANGLLLVAESAKRIGDLFLARRSVQQLAQHHGAPEMADALFGLDLLQTVNLKA